MNLDDLISRFSESPDERWDICAQLYNALDSGGTEPIDLAPFAPSFASFWRDIDDQVRPFQRTHGHSWRWREEYQDPRNEAVLLLDILGYVPGAEVVAELQSALTLHDQRLVMFAAMSLLRQRQALSPETISGIAACDETRNLFRGLLSEVDYAYLFPPEYTDPECLARSAMVEWLTNPTEWECAPDNIELMDIIGNDVFIYRFRVEATGWLPDEWIAGIAGRLTYSDFQPATSATAEDHAARMLKRFPDSASGHRH
jgi:hypothetical protein